MYYEGLGLSLGETHFEQVKCVALLKDGRGDCGTASRFLLRAGIGLEEEWPFQKSNPMSWEAKEKLCCRGERPPWFLPAPAQTQMQVK